MFVELVYDKRNVEGLEGAREIILAELTKRVHQIFPDAEVKVKPMQANGLNSDASKSDREKLNRMLEEMFEDSDMWLVSEFRPFARLAFNYLSCNIPHVCSGMNTEQPAAARSFLRRAAVFLAKPFQYAVFRYIKLHPVLAHQPVY
jgi:hypothetical protein